MSVWSSCDVRGREGFYWEHGVTLYLCVSHLQWRVTVVWILTKSYAHHFILFKAAAKVQGQIKHSISCPQINTQMIYAKMKTFFKIQTIIGYKSKALKQWIYHYRTSFAGLLRIINKEWVGKGIYRNTLWIWYI